MSNSNANLKHIIKSYKEETQQLPSNVAGSPNLNNSKHSKRSSLHNTGNQPNISTNLPPAAFEVQPTQISQESSDPGFKDYAQVYSSGSKPSLNRPADPSTHIKKQLLEQSRQQHNNSVPLKAHQNTSS